MKRGTVAIRVNSNIVPALAFDYCPWHVVTLTQNQEVLSKLTLDLVLEKQNAKFLVADGLTWAFRNRSRRVAARWICVDVSSCDRSQFLKQHAWDCKSPDKSQIEYRRHETHGSPNQGIFVVPWVKSDNGNSSEALDKSPTTTIKLLNMSMQATLKK